MKGQPLSHLLTNCSSKNNLTMTMRTSMSVKWWEGGEEQVWVWELRAAQPVMGHPIQAQHHRSDVAMSLLLMGVTQTLDDTAKTKPKRQQIKQKCMADKEKWATPFFSFHWRKTSQTSPFCFAFCSMTRRLHLQRSGGFSVDQHFLI